MSGMLEEHLFDLARVDVVAAADHEVLAAVDDEEKAVLIDVSEVSGVEPAVAEGLGGGLFPAEVALHHVVAADDDLADVVLARRQRIVVESWMRICTPQIGLPTEYCRRSSALTLNEAVLAVSESP